MHRIAIVDGDPDSRASYRRILAERGHTVWAYGGLGDCRNRLLDAPPDLLVLETRLPDGSGLEFASALRGLYPSQRLPIVFVASDAEESDYLRGYAAGASDFLSKPVSPAELAAKCAHLLAEQSSRRPSAPSGPMRAGTTFAGRYRIERRMGEGGYGAVYAARDLQHDGASVALKVLSPLAASQPECRWRFLREVYALGALRNPRIVRVLDNGEADGQLYFTMDQVRGPTLHQRVHERGPLPEGPLLDLLIGLAEALATLDQADLLHRDLKPSNILLSAGRVERPVLIDFGLARRPCDRSLTGSDMVLGTLGYLAPENLTHGQLDRRADLYALAMVALFAVTGSAPHASVLDEHELFHAVVERQLRFPGWLSDPLRSLLDELAALDPDHRPADARAVLGRLRRLRRRGGVRPWGATQVMARTPAGEPQPGRARGGGAPPVGGRRPPPLGS